MQRGKAIRARSPRRAAQERIYAKLRREFLEANPICQLCGERPATQVHHRRGRVGALLTAVDHWSAVDAACHQWVTEHPAESYRIGISEKRVS